MHALSSFDFATIRVMPRVERGEFLNAGVIVLCLTRKFLGARIQLNESRLLALSPAIDIAPIQNHLEAFAAICAGAPDAGPIARMTLRERFHWLVAPRSTVIQISPVHSGLCDSPAAALDDLFGRLVV